MASTLPPVNGEVPRPGSGDVHARWLEHALRRTALGGLSIAEDVVYGLLGLVLLAAAVWEGATAVAAVGGHGQVVQLLDHLLLILVFLELLHTILIFLRTHRFRHEPFLVVGIIAGIRRILVVTAAQPATGNRDEQAYLLELAVITLMILAMSAALWLSGRRGPERP
ncbi:MAG: phosphate-starvation-inducible PsiE family protein [Firmicutes bacterium]|nr:phosphate-starvation-inducible PsiE family protein [Bacillota bacterium]